MTETRIMEMAVTVTAKQRSATPALEDRSLLEICAKKSVEMELI